MVLVEAKVWASTAKQGKVEPEMEKCQENWGGRPRPAARSM